MKKYLIWTSAVLLGLSATAQAGHYVAGIEGTRSAAVPPPGFYYKGYAVHYGADDRNLDVDVTALANRLIFVSDTQVLGGQLGFETIIPLIQTDLEVKGVLKDKHGGIGDVFAGSFLGWHGERWHSVAGLGLWSDVGRNDHPADPGLGYSSLMLTLGGTYLLDSDGATSVSLLGRYEAPTRGAIDDQLTLEWALTRTVQGVDWSLVGYNQLGMDDDKSEAHAAGASVGYFWPSHGIGLEGAAYKEFTVKNEVGDNGPKGTLIRLSLVKAF